MQDLAKRRKHYLYLEKGILIRIGTKDVYRSVSGISSRCSRGVNLSVCCFDTQKSGWRANGQGQWHRIHKSIAGSISVAAWLFLTKTVPIKRKILKKTSYACRFDIHTTFCNVLNAVTSTFIRRFLTFLSDVVSAFMRGFITFWMMSHLILIRRFVTFSMTSQRRSYDILECFKWRHIDIHSTFGNFLFLLGYLAYESLKMKIQAKQMTFSKMNGWVCTWKQWLYSFAKIDV